ncbi:formyltransferase family protein [Streptomyces regalis]|uniref:formyltransferase family protein n=1 Tax=Streptomyces regalis TaxID=68262 RepID=UPI001ABFE05A|nr:formyltransferase family protein [Streptomyces regalis]
MSAPPSATGTPVPLRRRSISGPLRIGVLVSATGANLGTLLGMRDAHPEEFEVCLVASHGERVKALDVARQAGVEAWTGDFDRYCGTASAARDPEARARYRARAREWHDGLAARLADWERRNGELDLIVLAYHRWIAGGLLERYRGRMINQHPADLSVLSDAGARAFTGKDPVRLAMAAGRPTTRTSCFLVDETQDGGAVLAMGPEVAVGGRRPTPEDAWQQELEQKSRSDRPCLQWTVRAFAAGRLGLGEDTHPDGSRVVLVDGRPTPLGGRRLTEETSA